MREKFLEYVKNFEIDGKLPEMMELKKIHTFKVVEASSIISERENFSQEARHSSIIAATLHDVGRFEQLKKYGTFQDSKSIDHAVFSHDIVVKEGWLDDDPRREAILKAILYHNRRELPEGLDELTSLTAKCVRDADKLDIFRVLEELIANSRWREDRSAFWNLAIYEKPNPEVVDAISRGESVDYQAIKSLADFILIQVGWIKNDLYFSSSRSLAMERRHYEFRRKFLLELVQFDIDSIFERCCSEK